MSPPKDIVGVIRGLQLITEAGVKLQETELKRIWRNSSLRPLVTYNNKASCSINNVNITNFAVETAKRVSTVLHGFTEYASNTTFKTDGYMPNVRNSNSVTQFKLELLKKRKSEKEDEFTIKLTESDSELLSKLDMEHQEKLKKNKEEEMPNVAPNPKCKQKLSTNSKQRSVPSSRFGRMVSFGGLAAGLGLGSAAEYARRTFGIGESSDPNNLFLTPGNLDRIVGTLCKVRGAALKIGQLMSIQDDSIVNPELSKALERVRKSADFMPNWQVEQVMCAELGQNWRDKFAVFEEQPFAAASIGQVHEGKLQNNKEVAVKIQYPGVARSIDSDIDNLAGIMNLWNIFPKGMFLDNIMKVGKRELAWEVDYEREANCTRKFKQLLAPYSSYYVPEVIDDLSTKQVFTTELLHGIPVDQCFEMEPEHRHFIADKIMELCLLELLEFRYMQTDPNWANFIYDPHKKQILLLDFGASREYSKEFVDKYVEILKAACDDDRKTVLKVSKEVGFLTGYESKVMEDAHVDAVMILGEVFRYPGEYNFAAQDMMVRMQNLIPTMVTHRLCPPPDEVYSLHRKLSGIFFLCSKLKTTVSCRDKFLQLYNQYINN